MPLLEATSKLRGFHPKFMALIGCCLTLFLIFNLKFYFILITWLLFMYTDVYLNMFLCVKILAKARREKQMPRDWSSRQ